MRILIVHNSYRLSGGEDTAVRAELALLRGAGIEALEHVVSNEVEGPFRIIGSARLLANAAWSRSSAEAVRELCARFRPDVVHVHNFWMRLTPSIHEAACATGAAVTQTLHNFRLLCLNGSLMRDGAQCHDCVGRAPWRGVARRCYRDSAIASAALARMISRGRRRGVWRKCVHAFIAPSEYARERFIAGGLPADRVHVKPNFSAAAAETGIRPSESQTVLFAGRLSREKGVDVLLRAWAMAAQPEWRLVIAGDGPQRSYLEDLAASMRNGSGPVQFTGTQQPPEIRALMARARLLVLPSIAPETFGISVIEAFAAGRPAIVTNVGGQRELVCNGRNGFRVAPGDAAELAHTIESCFASGRMVDRMGAEAREVWAGKYTPRKNLDALLRIYETAMDRARREIPRVTPCGAKAEAAW
jgi:glycosyltransferase involved in cell wall biosynthesis